jgi:ribonucleoside-triphosphate reductase
LIYHIPYYQNSKAIRYIGDKENANSDSALVATKRSLIYNQLNKELYQAFFLNPTEVQACRDGYIYIHDMSARLDSLNCGLFRIGDVLKDGFEMGNVWYNEPNSLDTAFDVMGDVILSAAAQQYGGFTVPQLDKILVPYAEKSYKLHFSENVKIIKDVFNIDILTEEHLNQIERISEEKVQREFEQGFQGLEYKLNTVGSSRGDYPFITVTTGLSTNKWGIMASKTMLRVHMGGQGKKGFKKPVLFPKYVFLYDEELHGEGKILEEVFNVAVECSSKTMYPDFLSLSGEGYVPSMYKQYGEVVSPMGKASLQPM